MQGLENNTQRTNTKRTKTNIKEIKQTKHTDYQTEQSHDRLPPYYRNNLYTEEEKEKIWLELLDKQERWVLGKRVDISTDEEQYYKRLKQAQKLNKQLGYGTNEINWERRSYENERRNMNYRKRKGI